MFLVAGLTALAVSANAFVLGIDPQIMIDRAIDSPTLTVRYTGAAATLVELRINGQSIGTRSVTSLNSGGETNFTLNTSDLHSGDNEVTIRLFDRTGKLVGQEHTNIQSAPAQQGPVFLTVPKTGATVKGTVEINMGFDRDLKDSYVSFFVDGAFKKMTNSPPFMYAWDTEMETNGWHELEGWAIDETSNTHKTGKVRVFVDNPGGNTPRVGAASTDLVPSRNAGTDVTLAEKPLRNIKSAKRLVAKSDAKDLTPLPAAAPGIGADVVLGNSAGTKPFKLGAGIAMGPKSLLPTGTRNVKVERVAMNAKNDHAGMVAVVTRHIDKPFTPVSAGTVAENVVSVSNFVTITHGARIPNLASFTIALDSAMIDFHGVMPRVDDGVPMTPLRFLVEKKGGLVGWDNPSKTVSASTQGNDLSVHIGNSYAKLNKSSVSLEKASYLDHGRTIVPLSFMERALNVKIQYDKASKHVLITSDKK